MENKIIDINEWVKWLLTEHPSQKQITTIKNYWKCNKLEDYEKVFKKDIDDTKKFWWDNNDYSDKWVDHKYCWELDRLFDIQKFVPDCPQLSKIDIGYFAINDTIRSEKWKPYIQILAKYDKEDVHHRNAELNGPHTFRIIKLDFGVFQVYARQARSLWNDKKHIHVSDSNEKDEKEEKAAGYEVIWDDEQVLFMSVPKIKFNKALLKGGATLQKEKRLYLFTDNNTYGVHTNRYRLPELYYPTNIKDFVAYCYNKDLLDFAPSSISLWSKTDKDAEWSEEKEKYWGDWYTPEYCIKQTPWPVKNIKTEIELHNYIQERKNLKVIEISEELSKHAIAVYNKDVLFPLIGSITQEICNEFIEEYNNRNLFEIVK